MSDIVLIEFPATQELSELDRYDQKVLRRSIVMLSLALAICASVCLDVASGSTSVPLDTVLKTLLSPADATSALRVVIWDVRLPYALMAIAVGAALSLAGAEMQTILNNALASPFTLGVSAAASFGAALAIVLGLSIPGVSGNWVVSANAFVFAFGSVLLLQAVSRIRGAGVEMLVLFGIAMVFTFNALVAILQYVASKEALQQLVFWSMGSLSRASWEKLSILSIVLLLVVPFALHASWKLTALRLGEDRARSFGINVVRLRFFSLLRSSILAATAVSFVGTIGFIGLVGPHIARLMVGEDHRFYLPTSMLCGALVMSLASIASKTVVPGVLVPVGIVTALIGVPFFLILIFARREVP